MTEFSEVQRRKDSPRSGLTVMLKRLARRAIHFGRNMLEIPMQRSARVSSFYYFLFSREFDLEHQAVLAGKRAVSTAADGNKRTYILRRSVHRLEKGLVMQPRRKVFAEDYISTTVDEFVTLTRDGLLTTDESKWVVDVLNGYFSVVDLTPTIGAARQRFFGFVTANQDTSSVPYAAKRKTPASVTYEEFDALTRRRSSVRWYQDRQVPDELIRQAIDTACNAPSACNRQPYSFHVSTSREVAVALAKCTGGTAGFADNVQRVIAVTGNLAAYVHERDRHIIYIDASLATMQLLLALETLGLSSCVINWPDVSLHERRIRELLKLAVHERVIMLVAVGYADPEGGVPYSQKNRSDWAMKLVSL